MRLVKILLLTLVSIQCFCQKKVTYDKSNGFLNVAPYISFLADSSAKRTFDDIKRIAASTFIANNKTNLALGSTNFPFWFKIDFDKNPYNENLYLFLSVKARQLDVYVVDKEGNISHELGGFTRPNDNSYFKSNKSIFNLGPNPKSVFFKISTAIMTSEVLVSTIQPLYNKSHLDDLFLGGIIAITFAFALYNLFFYFSLKDKVFLYYFFLTLCLSIGNFRYRGLEYEFFWTEHPFFTLDGNAQMSITFIASFFSLSTFLNTKQLAPKLHYWLLFLTCFQAIFIPLDFLDNRALTHTWFYRFAIVISISSLAAGFYTWYLGYKPAKYFTISWLFFLASIIIFFFGLLGWLPLNNFFVYNSWQIGIALEAILTSLALAYRFNIIRQEAKDVQELVLQRAKENETLLLAHNQMLEEKLELEDKLSKSSENLNIEELLIKLQLERGKNKKLPISTVEGVILIPIPDIVRIEALGSYSNIFLINHKKIIASKNLTEIESLLDDTDFIRVHKSYIVNINFVERYIRGEGGTVIMPNGVEVSVSRTMKATLLEKLNIS